MINFNLKSLRRVDWPLVLAIVFLVAFGLAAIYSVALGRGLNEFGNFQKQLLWLFIALPIMLLISFFDYRLFKNLAWVGYGLSLLLLALVLTPLGTVVNGAQGWFDFGFARFQPVEVTKIFLIMTLADICSRYSRTLNHWKQMAFMAAVAGAPILLTLIQPDFGSAAVLFFIWLVAFLLIVKNKWYVIGLFAIMLAGGIGLWCFFLQPYQKDRITAFLDPSFDPTGSGYNVNQSTIAVGAGKFFGRGLGFGSQSQLKFIPESQTDFIFAVVAEEIGFVGVLMVIGLFAFLFYRLYAAARAAPDDYGMFLVLLTAAMLFFHIFINIGMCIGLLPVTGISLPLISYGGSFLLTIMVLLGINLSVYRFGRAVRERNA